MTTWNLARWVQTRPLTAWPAFACVLFSIGAPTVIRIGMKGMVEGCEFTPYLPFIFLSAVLLRWWQAAGVALASVLIVGVLWSPASTSLVSECFVTSAGIFLVSSAAMILAAMAVRRVITALQGRGEDESAGGIVFSLEQGVVWASWYGQGAPIRLGSSRRVSEMMKDFLAQEELARRLNSPS